MLISILWTVPAQVILWHSHYRLFKSEPTSRLISKEETDENATALWPWQLIEGEKSHDALLLHVWLVCGGELGWDAGWYPPQEARQEGPSGLPPWLATTTTTTYWLANGWYMPNSDLGTAWAVFCHAGVWGAEDFVEDGGCVVWHWEREMRRACLGWGYGGGKGDTKPCCWGHVSQ